MFDNFTQVFSPVFSCLRVLAASPFNVPILLVCVLFPLSKLIRFFRFS